MFDAVRSTPLVLAAAGSNAALITFVVYTLVVIAIAWFSHKLLAKRKFLSEYFLGSRGLGVLAFTLTFGATSASAGSFAGFPALIYTHGWVLAFWIASYMVVPICTMGILGKRLNQVARKSGAITLPDVFRERFNSRALAITSTLVIAFLLSFYLVPQFKLSAKILGQLLQDNVVLVTASKFLAGLKDSGLVPSDVQPEYLVCLLFFGLMVILYTSFGGFRAVVWTDVVQGFVMIFGVVFMLILALWQVGGLQNATEELAAMTPPRLAKAVVEIEQPAPDGGVRITADQWFVLDGETPETTKLFRMNQAAIIAEGKTKSAPIKVVEITTQREIDRILSRFPDLLPPALHPKWSTKVHITESKEFAHGAGQAGKYVTGPGPSDRDPIGFMSLGLAISFFVFWAISGTGQPASMVRLMAFDSTKTLKRSIACLSIYFSLIYFPLVVIFCCARVIEPGLDEDPDRIMPVMAFSLTEAANVPWLAGLLVAAPFAAAMSTVDSFLLMVSSSVAHDVYQRNINPQASQRTIKRLSYACVMIVGTVAMLGAVYPPKYLQDIIIFASGGLAAAFLMPMVMTLYWPRATKQGVLAAMLGGLLVYLIPLLIGIAIHGEPKTVDVWMHPIIWGFAASLLFGVMTSYATPRTPEHLIRKYFYK